MAQDKHTAIRKEEAPIQFAEFLETVPSGSQVAISNLTKKRFQLGGALLGHQISPPKIQLHCSNESCNGVRFFRITTKDLPDVSHESYHFFYLSYVCSNCQRTEKVFSLAAQRDSAKESGRCQKFGEIPQYGPPTPARLITLIGPDRELFLKGRRCENQGLGVGAFVYYRRVVEGQKNRILDEIIKVAHKVGAAPDQITALEAAKSETQFSKAIASVKNALPLSLLVNGHNPLTLLHSALSDGLHLRTDQHCLEVASSIRIVLAELSERLAQALKDEAELNNALARLLPKDA